MDVTLVQKWLEQGERIESLHLDVLKKNQANGGITDGSDYFRQLYYHFFSLSDDQVNATIKVLNTFQRGKASGDKGREVVKEFLGNSLTLLSNSQDRLALKKYLEKNGILPVDNSEELRRLEEKRRQERIRRQQEEEKRKKEEEVRRQQEEEKWRRQEEVRRQRELERVKQEKVRKPSQSQSESKKKHFSWRALWELILSYGGLILVGFIPIGLFSWAVSLIDSNHWIWGIILILVALGSISIAWYGWIAAAAILIPIWICTTSWWWLGGLILLFEVYSVYSACLTTDD